MLRHTRAVSVIRATPLMRRQSAAYVSLHVSSASSHSGPQKRSQLPALSVAVKLHVLAYELYVNARYLHLEFRCRPRRNSRLVQDCQVRSLRWDMSQRLAETSLDCFSAFSMRAVSRLSGRLMVLTL